ncbi:uncharacterized protein LOC142523858 [Primulina tabacum]|uniref:uncharacterized protein LOC142523858 n=1 Tax=Primulina tabacum TaxID=48773 RepID=UPI003F5AD74E
MDKEWIHLPSRLVPEYEEGVQKFLAQAKDYAKARDVILCPCIRCKNKKYMTFDKVYEHLIIKGFDPSYTIWFFHGETDTPQFEGEDEEVGHTTSDARDYEFADLLEDAETPLFPGCTTYTKLSASITLYNYKSTNGHTDSSFNELLKILDDMLPEKTTLPQTVFSMKKLLKPFDLGFEKIHACPNDCCLFRKELKELDSCPKCGSSRWKVDKVTFKVRKGVPEKVLRYFPVIPRFKRMFKSEEMAEDLIWHSNHKSQDHMMRHSVDSVAWDTINHKWPTFASDPRNLRLGLATDGFNPFGPKQPGNNIDVYLEPLVEDLNELWDIGVEAFDAFTKSMFNLKAILMWTINDFPAYGNLAGCATKGKFGCPICGEDVCSMWLKYSRKFSYSGHRRFLAPDHPFREKKKWFNGKKERKGKPRPLTGLEILNAVKVIENDWEKKRGLLLRHNFDVMHVEKNVCENIIGRLLNVKKKSKDGFNARNDLMHLNIRKELHPQEKGKNMYHLSAAPYTLSKKEMNVFCSRLKKIKLPDGYSSNIGNCVSLEDHKLIGLKSHDCHVLMQQLLSVALRSLLPKGPRSALFLLCAFYNELCQRVLDRNRLEQFEENIAETLCMLERYFPPAFITISVHLTIHLAREARLCGPVQFRWMYPFERMHIEELKQTDRRFLTNETLLQKRHMETFGYIINGYRFHTIDVERSTQDSGVSIEADTVCQSSANDYSHTVGRVLYYGVIRDIVLLNYYSFKVPVFRCDWANHETGIKMEDGFTLVNLHQGLRTFEGDPFILASQAKQVFYSRDNDESN